MKPAPRPRPGEGMTVFWRTSIMRRGPAARRVEAQVRFHGCRLERGDFAENRNRNPVSCRTALGSKPRGLAIGNRIPEVGVLGRVQRPG